MLRAILIKMYPGFKNSLQVIGLDCEKSISNETCIAFTSAILLLYTKHVEDNVRRNMPNVISEKKKEEILANIFGTKVKGLLDALDIDEFNAKLADLYTKWDCEENLSSFTRYFQHHKENDLTYHVMAGEVKAAKICTNPVVAILQQQSRIHKQTNKRLAKFKKMALHEFINQYEDLIEYQESDIQRTFLGLNSPYAVWDEFQCMIRNCKQ